MSALSTDFIIREFNSSFSKEGRTSKAMVMDITVRMSDCSSSDKGVRRKHGRHYHQYSVDTFLLTEIVAPSTVGCADGGRWSRSNRGDMHRLYLPYQFLIPYWGRDIRSGKFCEIRVLASGAYEMPFRLFSVGMALRAYISLTMFVCAGIICLIIPFKYCMLNLA